MGQFADLGCSQEVLRGQPAGKRGLGSWGRDGGSQDEYRRTVPHVEGWRSWGAQDQNLRGTFKIRGPHRRVSVINRGEIRVSGIHPRAKFWVPGAPPRLRAHYLDELDGQRTLAHAAAAHDHQLVCLAGWGVPGSRPPAPGPPPPGPGRRPAAHVATAAAAAATACGGSRAGRRGGSR